MTHFMSESTRLSEIIDLALTSAIERYLEMKPDEAYDAIMKDWQEQTALLLIDFLFNATCENCGSMPDYIEIPRDNDEGTYIVPICRCELGNRDKSEPSRPDKYAILKNQFF